MPVASIYEACGSRREVGRKIEEWGCKKEDDAKDINGTDIVSGYAGVFESDKVDEAEYETAVAAFPIDQADIRAINSEAGWTKRFDDQSCLKAEEDGRYSFEFVAVVKLTNKEGATETFIAKTSPIVELPPM